jgi:[acyl-carrier-protein] S-malonyltransferase
VSRTAFLFPGQGAQTVGMGQTLYESLPAARQLYDRAAEILGYDLAKVCFSGPAEKLNETNYSQPALFVTSLAALETLRAESPQLLDDCQATAGLSLGEYTALVFAGVLEFEAALRVVQERGLAMQAAAEATPSGMISVLGMEVAQLEELIEQQREPEETLQIANLLCPGNLVVSGHQAACQRLATAAEEAGAMKVLSLAVAGAFHTPIMQPAVGRLAAVLQEVTLQSPRIPVISNVDAQTHDDPEKIRELLVQQVVSPVLWENSMTYLLETEIDQFYEIGPGRVLRGLLRRINRKVNCENISG